MYNGFATQDDFHAWMQAEWAKQTAQNVAAQLAPSHRDCDHANAYCQYADFDGEKFVPHDDTAYQAAKAHAAKMQAAADALKAPRP